MAGGLVNLSEKMKSVFFETSELDEGTKLGSCTVSVTESDSLGLLFIMGGGPLTMSFVLLLLCTGHQGRKSSFQMLRIWV